MYIKVVRTPRMAPRARRMRILVLLSPSVRIVLKQEGVTRSDYEPFAKGMCLASSVGTLHFARIVRFFFIIKTHVPAGIGEVRDPGSPAHLRYRVGCCLLEAFRLPNGYNQILASPNTRSLYTRRKSKQLCRLRLHKSRRSR